MSLDRSVIRQHGQDLIDIFSEGNRQRGLTSAQLFTLAQTLAPYYILLQTGSIQAFVDTIGNIPVDGTVITTDIVTEFKALAQAYLDQESAS